ncbi:MAG: hypothetical protein IJ466_01875 [Clostridia bacterium]|nr:hypothetical protein [Clostridia bacterium]
MEDKKIMNPAPLNDDELQIVSGGANKEQIFITNTCPSCLIRDRFPVDLERNAFTCTKCGKKYLSSHETKML